RSRQMAVIHYDRDASLEPVRGRRGAVVGYGRQGHAQALNLRDLGVDERVAPTASSRSPDKAAGAGLRVPSVSGAAREAAVIHMLAPDQTQKKIYDEEIEKHLGRGKALFFAHGFNIHFGQIKPPPGVDVVLIAPKAPGHLVRRLYEEGQGTP